MPDPNDLLVLRRVPDELTGLLIVGDLESQGIPATVIGGLTAQLRAEAPGLVSVMVRRCDLARAEALLAEDELPEGWEDEAEAAPREDEDAPREDEAAPREDEDAPREDEDELADDRG
jgi:hypothetical protein